MRGIIRSFPLLLLMIVLPVDAQNDKLIATQLGEAVAPMTEHVTNAYTETVLQFMAGGNGFVAEGARSALKQRAKPAPGTMLRSITHCIKPDNVIDEDVQACVTGARDKTW